MRIAVVGAIKSDLILKVPKLPEFGQFVRADEFLPCAGGKGANIAVAVARAGVHAQIIGCVGDDEQGSTTRATLEQAGVDVQSVKVMKDSQSSMVILLLNSIGESTGVIVRGAAEQLDAQWVTRALCPVNDPPRVLVVTFDSLPQTISATIRLGRELGIPVIVDAGPAQGYGPEIWSQCTILTPNTTEASTLVGHPINDDASVVRAARKLLAYGPQTVVVRRGALGSFLATSDFEGFLPALPVRAVDATGAGDAFTGTLAVAVAHDLPLRSAVQRGNAAGAKATTRVGALASMPTSAEIDELLSQFSGTAYGFRAP